MSINKIYHLALAATLTAGCTTPPAPTTERFTPCALLGHIRQCITVPLADRSADDDSKQFAAPPAGKSMLYIVRPLTQEPTKKSMLFIDNGQVAAIAPETYAVVQVDPGRHRIKVRTDQDEDADMVFDVEAGKRYFLKFQVNLWLNTYSGKLTLVDETVGQHHVLKSKRVALGQ